jgi:hypothetical protein
MSQTFKMINDIGMKALHLSLFWTMAVALVLLSTACTSTEGQNSNISLQMPGTGATPRAENGNDQGFYQPPRDPQFNTALDQ